MTDKEVALMLQMNSDYLEGCHPAVLNRLFDTNLEQSPGYGLDRHCEHAAELIREAFVCPDADVHFAVGGTQTNALVIAAALRPYEGVLCADSGHIQVHETGAPEATGHKMLPLPGSNGKITAGQVRDAVREQADFEHTVKPGMVYISQPTELGTLYTLAELRELRRACDELGLILFADGARLGYGLTAPSCDMTPAEFAACCDVFYAGGTKCGALFGEAIVIRRDALKKDFRYMLKRQGAMLAKGRILGIQFEALFENGLYWDICRKATLQALRIRGELAARGIPMLMDSPTNQQYPILTDAQAAVMAEHCVLEPWQKTAPGFMAYRVCTSWATTEDMVRTFICALDLLPKAF